MTHHRQSRAFPNLSDAPRDFRNARGERLLLLRAPIAMPYHIRQPHMGKPMRFYFRAQGISVQLPGADLAGKLVLVWKRGSRRTTTEPFEVIESLNAIDGTLSRTASTHQDLAMICTMFRKSRGAFESKSSSFTLIEELADSSGQRKLGSASVDLASYASLDAGSDAVELSFMEGNITVRMTFTSHYLKPSVHGAIDETASVSSCGSFASSAALGKSSDEEAGASRRSDLDEGAGALDRQRSERQREDARREAAIEQRWEEEETRSRAAGEAATLRAELVAARERAAKAVSEAKYLRDKCSRLAHENRVLRREPRAGKRDEVVLMLETELAAKEQERTDMEEELSKAFGGLLTEAQARINSLTAERDRLLSEAHAAKRGHGIFSHKG